MNEAHRRFHDWLASGAEGDPPRDLAVHASVCDGCRQSIAAFDRLAGIDPGLARMPVEPTGRERGGIATAARLLGATAVLFSAAILGVGVSQLIGVERNSGTVAQATPTPDQNVLGGTATAQPSQAVTPSSAQETLTPLGTPAPTALPHPVTTPIPWRSTPRPIPTPVPTPIVPPSDTPIPTDSATPVPTETPTPTPTAPSPPQSVSAIDGVGSIQVNWQPPASDGGDPVVSYNVYRSSSPSSESFLTSVTGTSFTDTPPTLGAYYYVVTAVNGFGESLWSAEVAGTAS